MTPEEQKEFNIKCAEFMGYSWLAAGDLISVTIPPLRGFRSQKWNPYSDANDRNKVIERMKLYTFASNEMRFHKWEVYQGGEGISDKTRCLDESMEAAQIACISKVLEDK